MPLTTKQQTLIHSWRDELGRWHARQLGLRMDKGSWLHSKVNNQPVAHGYRALYDKCYRAIWGALNQEGKL